jgi:hypothetical protein
MKNKPDPALVRGSYLFNEIKKRTPKSRETIPLNKTRIEHFKEKINNVWGQPVSIAHTIR